MHSLFLQTASISEIGKRVQMVAVSPQSVVFHEEKRSVPAGLLWGFYAVVTLYFASLIIFARPDNVLFSNIANAVMIGYFLFLELFYGDRTIYLNSVVAAYGIFLLYALLSLFWTIDLEISAEMTERMVKIAINLLFVYNILKKYKIVSAIFLGLFLGSLVNFLISLHLVPLYFVPYFPGTVRFMGTTINPNITSSFMFYSIFMSILWLQITTNRWFIVIGMFNIAISYYVILMTVSRAGMVVAFALVLLFLLASLLDERRRGYLFWGAVLVGVGALFMTDAQSWSKLVKVVEFGLERLGYIVASLTGEGEEYSAEERLAFARVAWEMFGEHPLFGTGVDTVRAYLGVYSHNNYTELLANGGIVGFVLFYMIYIFAFVKALYVKEHFIRLFLLTYVLILFVYDLGGVSYYEKLSLMMIVTAAYIAELFSKEPAKAAQELI